MKKYISVLSILLVLMLAGNTYPQYLLEWVARCDTNAQSEAMALDSSGNIIVTGQFNGFLTIKYDKNGIEKWRHNYYTGINGAYPSAIGADRFGNIYVTGQDADYLLVKYDSNGVLQWTRRYRPPIPGFNYSNAMAIDDFGNVYITGGNSDGTGGRKFMTFKYKPNGDTIWTRAYFQTPITGGGAKAQAIGIDKNGNVYISGINYFGYPRDQFLTIKYDSAGNPKWVKTFIQPDSGGCGNINSLQIDGNGNIYICGEIHENSSDIRFGTIKYDSLGNQIWVRKFKNSQNNVNPVAMKIDLLSNIYITGYGRINTIGGNNIITVKYDSSGSLLWVRNYGDTVNFFHQSVCSSINGLFVDKLGNSYITGFTNTGPFSSVIQSIKYNTNGVLQWSEQYTFTPDSNNYGGQDIKVNSNDDIFVFGSGYTNEGIKNLFLIKYSLVTSINYNENNLPIVCKLFQNFPNPFNPTTNIRYQISKSGNIKLIIYDILGREIKTLINEKQNAGTYEKLYNASSLSSGVYFYSLFFNNQKIDTKTFILMK
jgi:hypothetical protein